MESDDFDCPTGTCDENEPRCRDISVGDTIDPNSVAHLERNECNACPAYPPAPRYITVRRVAPYGGGFYTQQVFDGFYDCEGNEWKGDMKYAAWRYHGDPHPLQPRDLNNTTYRVIPTDTIRGWQCRYVAGALDDQTGNMGTYDYADATASAFIAGYLPGGDVNNHHEMDVAPHEENGNYVPGLTRFYCNG